MTTPAQQHSRARRLTRGALAIALIAGSSMLVSTGTAQATTFSQTRVSTEVANVSSMNPGRVSMSPDGTYIYSQGVTNTVPGPVVSGQVARLITSTTPASIGYITVGLTPYQTAFTADSAKAYVTNTGGNSVSVIDTATSTVTSTITVGSAPKGIAVGTTTAGGRAYVANSSANTVSVINTSTDAVVGSAISLGSATGPTQLAMSPDGSKVYVMSAGGVALSIINTADNSVSTGLSTVFSQYPTTMLLSPDGLTLYFGVGGTVAAYSTTSLALTGNSPSLYDSITQMTTSADGKILYVAGAPSVNQVNSVSIFSASSIYYISDAFSVDGNRTTAAGVAVASNGTVYVSSLYALNIKTPQTSAPGAPIAVGAGPRGGSGTMGVQWSPPVLSIGSAVSSYTVQAYIGSSAVSGKTCTLSSPFPDPLTCNVTGLTNGTSYSFGVKATNSSGTGAESAPSWPSAPVDAPGAPTSPSATAGNAQAAVTWTAPSSAGGGTIYSYKVQAYADNVAVDGKTCTLNYPFTPPLTCTVTGLTNGTAYTFKVIANNGIDSAASTATSAVTPQAAAPGPPLTPAATGGNTKASVSWTPPTSDGGAPITTYTAQAYVGGSIVSGKTCTLSSPFTPPLTCDVTGLTNGTAYTFKITATNTAGTGTASAATTAATPAATVPGPPLSPAATAGQGQASVSWTAPTADGGSAITGYTVQAYDNGTPVSGKTCTLSSPFTPPLTCDVTGLTNGTAYTFAITATNAVGTGAASAATTVVTPQAVVPSPPLNPTATGGNTKTTVSWEASADDGGSPVTTYTVQAFLDGDPAAGKTCTLSSPFPDPLACEVTGLTNGTAYTFKVVATNAVGDSEPSAATSAVTPNPTAPGPPLNPVGTQGDTKITATWDAPTDDGGSAVTSYTVQAYFTENDPIPGKSCTVSAPFSTPLTCDITGLTNGDPLLFRVSATNVIGTGPESELSPDIAPAGPPTGPTTATATRGNTQASVTWNKAGNNGSLVTGYTVQAVQNGTPVSGKTCTVSSPFPNLLTCTVTGLTNGTEYTFTVTATNGVGAGTPKESNAVTPATVPGPPLSPAATRGNSQASVTWDAPTSTGGSAITSYTAQAYANNVLVSGKTCTISSPFTPPLTCDVTGLTNGTEYTFTITATNAIGAGDPSVASNAVTPAAAPGPPLNPAATPGDTQASVTWEAPTSDGGSAITSYSVQAYANNVLVSGKTCTISSPFTPPLTCDVTGLTNGAEYTFTINATNAVGTGDDSAASTAVIPAGAPAAPSSATAVAGNSEATVTWPRSSDNGSEITGYTVQAYLGGSLVADATCSPSAEVLYAAPPAPMSCTVTGLSNGTEYTFTVTATNDVGTSDPTESNAVTPTGPPGPPLNPAATGGNTKASVTWDAPATDGGSAITSYTAQAYDNGSPVAGATCTISSPFTPPLTCDVTGLTNGTAYTFTINATNNVATGGDSSATTEVTPAAVPGPPLNPAATRGNTQASVTWDEPTSDGGSAITSYTVQAYDDGTPVAGATCTINSPFTPPLTCDVTGLTNGAEYTFAINASNVVGTGPDSEASTAVTPATVPDAPAAPSADAGDAQASVTWLGPVNEGGEPITSYTVQAYETGTAVGKTCTVAAPFSIPLTCDVTGLTNGTEYTFTVTATNAVGDSEESPQSSPVTPAAVPGPPLNPAATRGDSETTVTWEAPTSDGGSPITDYAVQAYSGGTAVDGATCTISSPFTPPLTCDVTGLTNGTEYTFTVAATNDVGTGEESTATTAVTPATVPGAPLNPVGIQGDTKITATWDEPTSDGGSPITGYTVQAYFTENDPIPGKTCTITAPFTPPLACDLTGLTNGDPLFFKVYATNAVGDGPESELSPDIAPAGPPTAPGPVTAVAGDTQAAVTWSSSSQNGSLITGYTVQANIAGTPASGKTCALASPFPNPLTCSVTGLTNGTEYTFTVTATNGVGTGDGTTSNAVTPAGVPGPPLNPAATRGDTQATISWDAPTSDNGSPITGYTVQALSGDTPVSGATCTIESPFTPPLTCDITGLVNGTEYTFTVAATNAVGTGEESTATAGATPAALPGAPLNPAATRGAEQASVTWDAPDSDGGSAVASYKVQAYDGVSPVAGASCTLSSPFTAPLTCDVTGLTNGTAYTFTVTATNDVGTGPESLASAEVTPAAVPGAPLNPAATRGDQQAAVSWEAPSSDNGSPITGYTVKAYSGGTPVAGATCTVSAPFSTPLTCDVTGLTNGTAYTFTVTATNDVGTGPESDASTAVTPAGVPGAPLNPAATRGDQQASVTWDAPASDNGSPITGYTVKAYDGGTPVAGATCTLSSPFSTPLTCDVTGLTNGTAYTFTVTATNDVGTGPESEASTAVTPATVPDAPATPLADAGNEQVSVTWLSPVNDGGDDITSYTVQAYQGSTAVAGKTCTVAAPFSIPLTCDVTGLTNGTEYTFTVSATNGVAAGEESPQSTPATPATVPGAPLNPAATRGNTQATVTWDAPTSDGGSPITGYTVQASIDGAPVVGATCAIKSPLTPPLTCDVTGLTNGTEYTFTITATNSVGTGPESEASTAVTPATVPTAPLNPAATRGDERATVTWDAPESDGGTAITDYTVQAYDGLTPVVGAHCSITPPFTPPLTCDVTGLTNGTEYTFTITAKNSVGQGPASEASSGVTPTSVPGPPRNPAATRGNQQASVTWEAPSSDGGSPVIGYTVRAYDNDQPVMGATCTISSPFTTPLTCDVTGLTNGKPYTFTVTATNDVGPGEGSAASAAVTPATIPDAPATPSVLAGNEHVSVTWLSPVNDGGDDITSYTVQAYQGGTAVAGKTCTVAAPFSIPLTCDVTGLTNGTEYTFTVTATNTVGTSEESPPSSPVTPATVPDEPRNPAATAGQGRADVIWAAPTFDGGSPVTGYTVQAYDNGILVAGATCTLTAPFAGDLTCTVAGLIAGIPYTFTVTATNAVGTSEESVATMAVTPTAGPPGAPRDVVATAGDQSAAVTWTEPADDGGAPVTSYRVQAYLGGEAVDGATCTITAPFADPLGCTVTGLTNGVAYTFAVTAINSAGSGDPAAAATAVTPDAPPAPTTTPTTVAPTSAATSTAWATMTSTRADAELVVSGPLAYTGVNAFGGLLLAVSLVAAGSLILLTGRRRGVGRGEHQ